MRLRLLVWGLVALVLSIILAVPVAAANAIVGDGSAGSCTESALNTALNQVTTGATVSFNCGSSPVTITVTSPKLITRQMTIDGGGLITLSGGGTITILDLDDYLPLLTLKNLTIADGYATPAGPSGVCRNNACGGGVRGHFRASLTVINSKFVNNRAVATTITSRDNLDYGGGGIYIHSGTLTVNNSQFTGNSTTNGAGGAIHVLHGNMTVSDTLFDNNQSTYYAGAIYTDGMINDASGLGGLAGSIYMLRNTFTNNQGKGQGGAVFNYLYVNRHPNVQVTYDSNIFDNNSVGLDWENFAYGGALRVGNGPLRILNSLFSNNTAQRDGGAIYSGELVQAFIWNTTFYANHAVGINADDGFGGALKIASTRGFNLINATIVNNTAGQLGGGIFASTPSSGVILRNTIVANNTATNPWKMDQNCDDTYAGSNNIQTPQISSNDVRCAPGVKLANPVLGSLADNEGFTKTIALLANSPAIDAGASQYCLETDQRGRYRTFDGNYDGKGECDIGAFEYASFDNTAAANALPYINFFPSSTITVDWSHVDWAAGYQVEIDNNDDFTSVNERSPELGVQTQTYTTAVSQEGLYYWRVRAKRADGSWGNWSTPDHFLVRMLAG
jgi:predicted outer membrane repeat protein